MSYCIEITDAGTPSLTDETIFSLNVPSTLMFELKNGTKISNEIQLVSNFSRRFPEGLLSSTEDVSLDSFKPFLTPPSKINTSIYFTITITKPDITTFCFLYQENEKYSLTKPFTILFNPIIDLGKEKFTVNEISMQTVLSKNIGTLADFEKYYKECSLLKYNFIHFTSIQQLSDIESIYILKSHSEISDRFFTTKTSTEEKFKAFAAKITALRDQYSIGGAIDIILNQASTQAQWIHEHPNCAYNLQNSPWLTVAYELDKILVEYSEMFYNKKVACASAPYINNDNDIEEVISEMKKEISRHNLEEFFLIPIDKYYDQFKKFYALNKDEDKDYTMKRSYLLSELKDNFNILTNANDELDIDDETLYELISNSCTNYGEDRYGVKIEVEFVSMLVLELLKQKHTALTEFTFLKSIKENVNRINSNWRQKCKQMVEIALANVREFIRYEFIQLKRTGVRRKLIDNYFHVVDENDKSKIFLCNGWIMQSEDPDVQYPDITKYGSWYYFKRKVVICNSSIKLNYSNSIDTCEKFLIEYMINYVTEMASLFDGFVLDNILSIPNFALKLLITAAKEKNPNLITFAQLPDGDLKNEVKYVNSLGVNLFIKEMIWCTSPFEIAERLSTFGKGYSKLITQCDNRVYNIAKESDTIILKEFKYLKPQTPNCILFDLTQDNQSYYEQYGSISLNMSMMACLGLIDSAIGTTRGYDQLFPYQPSTVKENRTYEYDDTFEGLLYEIKKNAIQKEKTKEVFFEFHPRTSPDPLTRTVRLALSSNDWKPDISLTKINNNLFTTRLMLPKGKYYYKYVIDNNIWTYDSSQPMEYDSNKNINNVIDISDDTKLLAYDLKLIRRDLNNIREELRGKETEVYIRRDKDMICIIRTLLPNKKNDLDYDGFAVLCRPGYDNSTNSISSKIEIPGEISSFVCGCYMTTPPFEVNAILSEPSLGGVKGNIYYTKDLNFLSSISTVDVSGGVTKIDFHSILPNTVVVVKMKMSTGVNRAVKSLNNDIALMMKSSKRFVDYFDICDINSTLFRTEAEEKENTFNKRGLYVLDKKNLPVYAGIYQFVTLLQKNKKNDSADMSLLLNNVIDGNWLMDYISFRLSENNSLNRLSNFLNNEVLPNYSRLYPHLKPLYFDLIIESIYYILTKELYEKVPSDIINYGTFAQNLTIARTQFIGHCLSSTYNYSLGLKQINIDSNEIKISISSGLPNCATGYFRWNTRDTLLSFKALFLLPRLFSQAKTILKIISALVKHGCVPSIVNCGDKPRYDARDTSFMFINAIKDYVEYSKDNSIMNEEIEMLYIDEDDKEQHLIKKSKGIKRVLTISEIIQEIFSNTAKGIRFNDEGRELRIYLDCVTGFVYGGCGNTPNTWMNKVGTSTRGHNRNIPATPRHGADIEIIAYLYSSLDFIITMSSKGYYRHKSVTLPNGVNYPFTQWKLLIKDNFEQSFFLSRKGRYNKEGIYKDYLNNDEDPRHENQLRPNALIAICACEDLFTPGNVRKYLANVEQYLLNEYSIRSLDKEDSEYKGYYNGGDNGEYLTSCGFNVHNGLEYIWLFAMYLLVKIDYNKWSSKAEIISFVTEKLLPLEEIFDQSIYNGFPEILNERNEVITGEGNTSDLKSLAMIYEVVCKLSTIEKY